MANTVKQGTPGQLVEQQGSINVREGIKVWNGTEFVDVISPENISSVTPEMFGAKGDGTTDDTAALQAAIDSGQNVSAMPGKTYLTGPLQQSQEGQLLDFTGSTLKLLPNQSAYLLTQEGEYSIVRGGTFDGNKGAGQTEIDQWYNHASVYVNAKGAKVQGVISTQSAGIGIKGGTADDMVIDGCAILDYEVQGIFVQGSGRDCYGNKLINNTVYQPANSGSGVYLKGDNDPDLYYQRGFEISGNTVYGATSDTTTLDICISVRAIDGIISNNYTNGGDMGISADISTNCSIFGNRIETPNGPTGYCLEVDGPNNAIYGNVLVGGQYGIIGSSSVSSGQLPLDNNVIIGNQCTGQSVYAISFQPGAGSYTAHNLLISKNYIQKATGNLIYLSRDCKYSVIEGNMFVGGGSGVANNNAIFLDSVNSNVTVRGNNFNALAQMVVGYNITATALSYINVIDNIALNDVNTSNLLSNQGTATLGTNIIITDNITLSGQRQRNYTDRANNIFNSYYNGASPEGVVAAGIGSVLYREFGGLGQTIFVKETGTGNTGWGGVATIPYLTNQQYARYTDTEFTTSVIRNLGNDLGGTTAMSIGTINNGQVGIRSNNTNILYVTPTGLAIPTVGTIYNYDDVGYFNMTIGGAAGSTQVRRNKPDIIPAFSVRNQNSGTATIIMDFQGPGGRVSFIDINGFFDSPSTTTSIDFGSVPANSELAAPSTITLTGAAVGDCVLVGAPHTDGIVYKGVVTSANTITLYACNFTTSAIDPASGSFKITIIK